MGARTVLSEEQYLHSSFPGLDMEFRDGELVERSLPTYLHGRTQGFFFSFFLALSKTLSLFPTVETRLKLGPGKYLIPDVAVFHPSEPVDGVPDTPPLVAIEILSPDDRMSEVRTKLAEYRDWGVAHVWLVDPHSRVMFVFDAGFREVPALPVPELNLEVKPEDIFES